MRTRHSALAVIGLLAITGSVLAAPATEGISGAEAVPAIAPRPDLSLGEVVSKALTSAPEAPLPGAYANEAAAQHERSKKLFAGPAEAGLHYQNDQYMSDLGLREWEAELDLPLWRPGQRDAQRTLSLRTGRLAQTSSSAVRLQVAGRVREAVWQLLLTGEQVRLAKQVWDTAEALVRDVKRRVETGDLPRTDLLVARDDALTKRDRYLSALKQLQDARSYYMQVTGLNERPANPGEDLAPARNIPPTHPDLQRAQARVDQARSEVRVIRERGSGQPRLVVNAREERTFANERFQNSLGVGIRIPFGGGAHQAPEIAAAQRALTEAEVERERLRRELQLGIQSARQQLATLKSELSLAEQRAKNGKESLRMGRIAFNVGEMDLAEFLRVQTRAQAAESDLRLRRLELKRAIAQYNQTVGVLP